MYLSSKEAYSLNPSACKHCSITLLYTKKHNTFCSQSCSATFNKQLYLSSKETYSLHPSVCKHCSITIPYTKRHNTFCSSHCSATFNNNSRILSDTAKKNMAQGRQEYWEYFRSLPAKPAKPLPDPTLVPATKHAVIRFCRLFLNQDTSYPVTLTDLALVKQRIHHMIHTENMLVTDIQKLYQIKYSNFSTFIKDCLGVPLATIAQALKNYCVKQGTAVTDEKKLYQDNCRFKFNPYDYTDMLGFDLFTSLGMYHAVTNPGGADRDHMVSIEYGWRNQVDPALISHPANCQFLVHMDNVRKGSGSDISVEELQLRIEQWNITRAMKPGTKAPRMPFSDQHRQRLGDVNRNLMTLTNGSVNIRRPKGSDIPDGYWRGMTRNNKKSGRL